MTEIFTDTVTDIELSDGIELVEAGGDPVRADPDGALDITSESDVATELAKVETREWRQQPGEPPLWFHRFGCYLMLPPGERSIAGAYKKWLMRTSPHKARDVTYTPKAWRDRAGEWKWQQRAAAYDIAEHNRYIADEESHRHSAEEKCRQVAVAALDKALQALKEADPLELSLHGAIKLIPDLIKMTMELFEFGHQKKELSLDAIMAAMPAPLRTQLLTEIRIEQMNVSVQGKDGSMIEGELVA